MDRRKTEPAIEPSHLSSTLPQIEPWRDEAGVEKTMLDEVLEKLVRQVVREELSELPTCAGRAEVARASEEPEVLTVPEAAEVLRISRNRTYSLVREGRLRSVRVGRRVLVPSWAVQEMLGGEAQQALRTCGSCGAKATAR